MCLCYESRSVSQISYAVTHTEIIFHSTPN